MSPSSIIISTSNDIQPENITCDKIVLLLCGLPGAGKSTLARHFVHKHASSVALIEYDEIQDELLLIKNHNNNNQQQQQQQQQEDPDELLQAWRSSRTAALQTLSERVNDSTTELILLDDNFQLSSMRKQIFQVCQSHVEHCINNNDSNTNNKDSPARSIYFGLIWMDTPVQVCLERNQQRPWQRRVPDRVIQNMKHTFEVPGEKAWEESFLRLHGTDSLATHLEQLLHFIATSSHQLTLVPPRIDPTVEQARRAMARQETLASTAHQLDQYLRCCVQVVAKHQKQWAGVANQCRKQLLADGKHRRNVVMEDLEHEFLDQIRRKKGVTEVDWEAFQPILHRELLVKQADLNETV